MLCGWPEASTTEALGPLGDHNTEAHMAARAGSVFAATVGMRSSAAANGVFSGLCCLSLIPVGAYPELA